MSTDCSGAPGDDLGVMSIEECCLNTPNSLGFSEGQSCSTCIGECIVYLFSTKDLVAMICIFFIKIVFGFFQDSFIGVEQGQGHTVQAGYQKGAAFTATNLVFTVMDTPSTASEFTVLVLNRT